MKTFKLSKKMISTRFIVGVIGIGLGIGLVIIETVLLAMNDFRWPEETLIIGIALALPLFSFILGGANFALKATLEKVTITVDQNLKVELANGTREVAFDQITDVRLQGDTLRIHTEEGGMQLIGIEGAQELQTLLKVKMGKEQ
jgi:hypothetical protein